MQDFKLVVKSLRLQHLMVANWTEHLFDGYNIHLLELRSFVAKNVGRLFGPNFECELRNFEVKFINTSISKMSARSLFRHDHLKVH